MERAAYLALDAGTGGGRAVVFDAQGRILGRAYRAWTYHTPPGLEPYGKEFSADRFWSLLGEACREALAGLHAADLRAVSATAMRQGCVFLDRAGCELYAGPNRDARGIEAGVELEAQLPEAEFAPLTGHWPPFLFAPGRLLWFRENAPDLFGRIARVLMLPDWLLFRLTGEAASEPSSASGSFFLDVRTRRWSPAVCAALGLDPALLPLLAESGSVLGRVTDAASRETGIPAGTPVAVGGADTQCALLAAGADRPGSWGVVAGTTAPLIALRDEPTGGPAGRIWTECHMQPGVWMAESNAGDAGRIFRWYVEGLVGGDYAAVLAEAAATPPGSHYTFAALGPMVFNLKELDPGRRTGWLFPFPLDEEQATRGALARAILENIAFALRGNYNQLSEWFGDEPEAVRLAGGLARSELFAGIVAAALGRPLEVCPAAEASALGAAMTAATAAGDFSDLGRAAEALAPARRRVEPNAEWVEQYDDLYGDWAEQTQRFESAED